MIEILTSILGGGVTGLLGKGLERYFDHKAKKLEMELNNQKFAHEAAMRKADAEIMAQEWAQRTKIAEVEASAKVEVEDAKAFAISLQSEPEKYYDGKYSKTQAWLMVILDFCRGFIRIGLTTYLCILTTLIYLKASQWVSLDTILPTMAYDLVSMIINTILYLTTTAILWQFGSRGNNAPINKK